jgi:hypothetical protein
VSDIERILDFATSDEEEVTGLRSDNDAVSRPDQAGKASFPSQEAASDSEPNGELAGDALFPTEGAGTGGVEWRGAVEHKNDNSYSMSGGAVSSFTFTEEEGEGEGVGVGVGGRVIVARPWSSSR